MSAINASCTEVSTALLAALIALTDSARLVWYLIVAGTICFLAMSIIVSASMLIVLEYVSYITSARDSISAFVYTPCFSKISTASGFTNAGTASTIHLMFGSPLLSASATHSSEYPLPLKMILLCAAIVSLIMSWRAIGKSSAASSLSAMSHNTSATIVLSTVLGSAIDCVEPTIRNSNLLPVNANGDVLLRSVASFWKCGRECTPEMYSSPSKELVASNCSPKNTEIIAGGASFAPKRWSLPGVEAERRSKSACSSTARRIAAKNNKNCIFSCGVSPGSKRFSPSSVHIDQLLCLPEPLIPANGFSCKRHLRPNSSATLCAVSITNWLWSVAMLFWS